MDKELQRAVARAEAKAGIGEGHYLLGDSFVAVWLSFYPRTQWWIADAERPTGSRIEGTTRKLDELTKGKLESWL